ncbi:unnamed protein product [Caenorhabditis angaria]|uniref:Schwannomin interacting protein 1 C-terminal domain-containing protein n=1 Tax=Caenorhabditis angaria TaxID=860376 RepID=A0A9P1J5X6_9PELO|nr:unnamed protein product [Caenorhabditis angaria]
MVDEWICSSTSANDSGVSTIDSTCSVQLQLHSPKHKDSFAEILMNEHNNNVSTQIDVVKLLELKSTDEDDEDQHSNSSSLESINSLTNHQGSQEREEEDDTDSGSTSCSEDSFEMSSACSIKQLNDGFSRDSRETTCESLSEMNVAASNRTLNQCGFERCKPSSSYSVDSFIAAAKKAAAANTSTTNHLAPTTSTATTSAFEKIRHRVANQIEQLDTGLPNLDFDKLEKQLASAAQEREDLERRMLGEEVRRRLAMQVETHNGPSPQVYTRPHRSNLALRLQTAMNLQVCYMNEMSESETENEFDDDSEDDDSDNDFFVRKSKSEPNLKSAASTKEAQQVKNITDRLAKSNVSLTCEERNLLLKHETKRVLLIAKNKAEDKLSDYRRGKSKASDVPRQARQYLSKTKLKDIEAIRDLIENAIAKKNMELVQLLLERDSLHMEHDSLRVDIDDFTQHDQQSASLNFQHFMNLQKTIGEKDEIVERIKLPKKGYAEPIESKKLKPSTPQKLTPVTPLTTPTSPTLSFASVIPNSFSISSLFKR